MVPQQQESQLTQQGSLCGFISHVVRWVAFALDRKKTWLAAAAWLRLWGIETEVVLTHYHSKWKTFSVGCRLQQNWHVVKTRSWSCHVAFVHKIWCKFCLMLTTHNMILNSFLGLNPGQPADDVDHPPYLFFSAQVTFDHVSMILCGISTVELLRQTAGVRSRVLDKSFDVCAFKISYHLIIVECVASITAFPHFSFQKE